MRNTKGQVTVFIILGVLIVLVATVGTYLRNDSFREQVQGNLFKTTVVPEQAQGVVNFVSGCIEDITKEGIDVMGMQGGYIDIPETIKNNPQQHLDMAGIKIPYWLYSEAMVSNIPSMEEMELDLKNFIERKFSEECDLNFYRERGYVIPFDDLLVNVDITDEQINIDLDSRLKISIKENTFDLDKFIFVQIPSGLKELYEMSVEIIRRESENAPLEFNTLNLISIYGHHPSDEIPPLAGMEVKCGDKSWIKPNVKEVLRNIVEENTVKLKVKGSDSEFFEDEFYETMVLDINKNHPNVAPRFTYSKDWPFYLDISPSDNFVIEGNDMKLVDIPVLPISAFCLKDYNFKYDVKYPLLVELVDKDDFIFRYIIEVDIKDNYGRQRPFDINLPSDVKSLVCEEGQKLSEEMIIETWDSRINEPLENVDITFNCVKHYCSMGKTSLDEYGISSFVSKFPLCSEGELVLSKEGYLPYREKIRTYVPNAEPSYSVSAHLEPLRKKNATIKIFDVVENELIPRNIAEYETAVVQINRYNDIFGDYDFKTSLLFEGNEEKEFDIIPAEGESIYQVQINLINTNKIHIPEYRVSKEVTIPSFDLDGNTIMGGSSYEFILEKEDLDKNEKIMFKVLSNGVPENYEELQEGMNIKSRSNEFVDDLRPELKNE